IPSISSMAASRALVWAGFLGSGATGMKSIYSSRKRDLGQSAPLGLEERKACPLSWHAEIFIRAFLPAENTVARTPVFRDDPQILKALRIGDLESGDQDFPVCLDRPQARIRTGDQILEVSQYIIGLL